MVSVTWEKRGRKVNRDVPRLLLRVGDLQWHISQREGLKLLRDLQKRLLYADGTGKGR